MGGVIGDQIASMERSRKYGGKAIKIARALDAIHYPTSETECEDCKELGGYCEGHELELRELMEANHLALKEFEKGV